MPTFKELSNYIVNEGATPNERGAVDLYMMHIESQIKTLQDKVYYLEKNSILLAKKMVITSENQAAAFTWSNIPNTGSTLLIITEIATDDTDDDATAAYMRFNGDTGANYDFQSMSGFGANAVCSWNTAQTGVGFMGISAQNAPASSASGGFCWIPHYNQSNLWKTYDCYYFRAYDDPTGSCSLVCGNWRSTAKINSITIYDINTENFAIGSVFSLYVYP